MQNPNTTSDPSTLTTHGIIENQIYQYAIAKSYNQTAKKCPLNRSEKKMFKMSS